jgi:isoquinoline 1-oxidoreductase beta subunit
MPDALLSSGRLSRRRLIQTAGAGALLIGMRMSAGAASLVGAASPTPSSGEHELTAWVRILPNGDVALLVSQAEIGQGISTTLPALLAEELGADWRRVRLLTAPYRLAYRNPKQNWMFTGNSESIQSFHDLMRQMGAAAREMLVAAASTRWHADPKDCSAADSAVWHRPTGRKLGFAQLAADAARLPIPASPTLRPVAERTLIGKPLPRVDVPAKVDGSAIFGIDQVRPGMLNAAVRTVPEIGGSLASLDTEAARRMPGVKAIVPLPDGVAVVADRYWQAARALRTIVFHTQPTERSATADSAYIARQLTDALRDGPWAHAVPAAADAPPAGKNPPTRTMQAEYRSPFAAHATMEPMNCVADVRPDRCEVWAPTQGQELTWHALQAALKLGPDQVFVNRSPYIGGAFGRRLLPDFAVQAALISKAVGRPVKLIWDREEDQRRDAFRPASAVHLRAELDNSGAITALDAKVVSPTILLPVYPAIQEMLDKQGIDPSAMEGMTHSPYRFPRRTVDFHLLKVGVPTSVMRTTGYGPNIFALESFIDEVAIATRQDPLRFRRNLLSHDASSLALIDRLAVLSRWGTPLPPGHGRGIAFAEAFGTLLGLCVELPVDGEAVKLKRAIAVVDCGPVLDPGIARASIEGGIVFGMAYCKSEITFTRGRVDQDNFSTYVMPYLSETPDIHVEFMASSSRPLGGVGETSPVVATPAIANAIFAATGRRLREMPLSRSGLHFA